MKKSIAVLGLGEYGMSLVRALNDMGADVLAADRDEENMNAVADFCVAAVCTDLEKEENLISLGLQGMDVVVVSMGRNLEASILAVAVAKELGVPLIVAKSSSVRMSSILRKVGANRVIVPEEYAGMRSASMLISASPSMSAVSSREDSPYTIRQAMEWSFSFSEAVGTFTNCTSAPPSMKVSASCGCFTTISVLYSPGRISVNQ